MPKGAAKTTSARARPAPAAPQPTKGATRQQRTAKPQPQPEEEEEDAEMNDEDAEEEFSEPEEADNEQLMAEADGMEVDDDDEDAEDDEEDAEEEDAADEDAMDDSAAATSADGSSSKKRAHGDSASAGGSSKKSRASASFILPTSEEMSALRQTEELFQSNLFKLALEELVKEIEVDYGVEGKIKKIEPLLHALKGKIEAMEPTDLTYDPARPAFGAAFPHTVAASVAAAASSSSSSSGPATAAHTFPFRAPSAFHLVGSYPLKTGMREKDGVNIDLALEMPAECLKQKDYWDYRYLAKRARWLQHVAEHLTRSGEFAVKVGKMRGAGEKPVLLLYPRKANDQGQWVPYTGILAKTIVRVFAMPPQGFFSAKRFHPTKSNLHTTTPTGDAADKPTKKEAKGVKKEAEAAKHVADDSNAHTGAPTPYYNSLLSEDLFYTQHMAALYDMVQSDGIRECLLLLRLWSKQRRLDQGRGEGVNGGWGEFDLEWTAPADASAGKKEAGKKNEKKKAAASSTAQQQLRLVSPSAYLYSGPVGGCSGFNGFFFSMFLLHLTRVRAVYRAMSTYQLFKQVLQQIIKLDLLAFGMGGGTADATQGGIVLGYDPAKQTLASLALLTNPLAGAAAAAPKEVEMLAAWHGAHGHEVVFLDGEGLINLTARVTRQTWLELKQEAFLSLAQLDDSATLLGNIFGNGMLENAASATQANLTVPPAQAALQTLLSTSKPLASAASLGPDTFSTLFMRPVMFREKYDAFVRVALGASPADWRRATENLVRTMGASFLADKVGVIGTDADVLTVLVRQMTAVLELALGDRILLMHVRPVYTTGGGGVGSVTLEVGLLLNPYHASRILDAGPSAEVEPAAQRFRDLWGDLSTLRRFKDGSIVEAVVWTMEDKSGVAGASAPGVHSSPHLIPFQIITYVLGRHLAIGQAQVEFVVSQFDSLLKLRKVDSQPTNKELLAGSTEAKTPLRLSAPLIDPMFLHSSTLFASFKSLAASLKSLAEIPLTIVNIRMQGEAARYTAAFPPIPTDILQLVPSQASHALAPSSILPVLLQFESSSRWPEDSLAISRIKSAFYIQIGSALQTRDIQSLVSLEWIDIFYHGYLFRLRIFQEQEHKIRLVEEKLSGGAELGSPMIPVMRADQIERAYIFLPLLSQQLKFVQEQYPLFAPTARLVKRWLAAHMFSPFFPQGEVVDLLVASLFTAPKPYSVPGTALQGFHRFLLFLGQADFATTPILVDLTGDLRPEKVEQMQAKFQQHRAAGTGGLIYIATESDPDGHLLRLPAKEAGATTEANIDPIILERLIKYARGSAAHLDGLLSGPSVSSSPAQWKSVFKTPLTLGATFDALIHLRTDAMPIGELQKALAPPASVLSATVKAEEDGGKKKAGYKLPPDAVQSAITFSTTGATSSHSVPLVGFHAVDCLLASLRQMFGARAYFFYDGLGGTVIGVQWRSEFRDQLAKSEVKFSVKATQHARPVFEQTAGSKKKEAGALIVGLAVHLPEIVADIRRAGKGLVDRVETA